eukprot:10632027-Prorocentrum_lima.AAC.1
MELATQMLKKGNVRVHVHVCLQRMEVQLKVKHAQQLALCGAVPFAVRGGQNGACVIDKSWSNSGAAHFYCS